MPSDSQQPIGTHRPAPRVNRLLAIIAITIGYVLNPLNGSLAVTAYPILSEHFGVPYAHLSAMVMYFMAATAVGQPLAGGIGDLFGRRNVFLVGIVGFTLSSALASMAHTYNALLFWRVGQAVFSGVIMANGMALVAQVAPAEKVTTYVAFLNSAFVAATVFGFTLGGLLLQWFDWPVLFQLNVPLGIAALVLALFFIPGDSGHKVRFTALSFIGVPFLPLALGLQALVQQRPFMPYAAAFIVSLLLVGYAIFRSNSSREQFQRVANLRFNLGCLILFFAIALHFAVMFTLPGWAGVALNIESGMMGIYFSIIAGSQVLSSPGFGKLIDRFGDRYIRLFAVLAIAISILVMVFYLNRFSFALALALLGCGMAAAQLLAQRSSLLAAPADSRALAMGIFSSYRSVGGLSGNALAAVILASYTTITVHSGVEVLEWGLLLFVIPVSLTLWGLGYSKRAQP